MSTDSHTFGGFGQPATHCGNCHANAIPLDRWDLAAPSSGFSNAGGNHRNVDSFVPSPSHNASPNLPLARIPDATTTGNQHIPIWSQNLSPGNRGFQQRVVSTTNNGWNLDLSITPLTWDSASQGFAQSLSLATPGLDQNFIPSLSAIDYPPVHSNATANGQPDINPTLQLPDFGGSNDFGVVPNAFANFNPFPHLDDLTAIDPQATMTSFNNLPGPTTISMPAAPVLPTNATSMFTAPAEPRPIAKRVASRRSHVNINPHICEYPGCGKEFNRLGDLVRHRQQHGVPQYPCLVHGCNRRGSRAFYRPDKLRDHQRKKHRMAI
ncbi:hypothetical protein G7Y89_g3620 [Cudoniella acicularis]|uniref:C2H2-type domain-containing protein n=1 Tax=Cudoniella acicularis TaxID=354080 RepID=A0A8H4W5S8_9HELO|nr:hypothetical protein G7Y89_g3620 [Cudoniella acicularis]